MSHEAVRWALDVRGLRPGPSLVLIRLADHANSITGRCFPSHATLMEETGFGRDAIREHLRALMDAGLIVLDDSKKHHAYVLNVGSAPADRAEKSPYEGGTIGRKNRPMPEAIGRKNRHDRAEIPAYRAEKPPLTREGTREENQGGISISTVAPSPSHSQRAQARDEPPRNVIAFPKADPPATEGSLFGEPAVPALASPSSAEAFEASWAAYGRKGSKAEARREWDAAVKRLRAERPARGPSDIRRALDERLPFMAEEFKYRPDFCRWLKRSLFDEDVEAMARRRNSRPVTVAEEMLHDLGMTAAEIDAMCNPPRRTTHGD